MLYTRKGDAGTSTLFGSRSRLPKDSPIYEALGCIDELNSLLGVCYSHAQKVHQKIVYKEIRTVQEALFVMQAELAGSDIHILRAHIDSLERSIDTLENSFVNPHSFVIAGATELSALLDYARAVARRLERTMIRFTKETSSKETRMYLNRLSSHLYALARYAATAQNSREVAPTYTIN